jgi:Na+/proline symporter
MDFVGVSGQSYRFGMAVGNFDWLGSMPAMLLAAFIFIPYFWKAGLYTIPEYLGRRYNDGVRAVASMTWIILLCLRPGCPVLGGGGHVRAADGLAALVLHHCHGSGRRPLHLLWRPDRRGDD